MYESASDSLPANFDAYAILALPPPQSLKGATLTTGQVKAAYRKALLLHHPDKSSSDDHLDNSGIASRSDFVTIDSIALARDVLLSPPRRAAHDLQLKLRKPNKDPNQPRNPSTELETVDLDDLTYIEDIAGVSAWTRHCRCGDPVGFHVSEDDLEEALHDQDGSKVLQKSHGEILVCCDGCSLMLRVGFATA